MLHGKDITWLINEHEKLLDAFDYMVRELNAVYFLPSRDYPDAVEAGNAMAVGAAGELLG